MSEEETLFCLRVRYVKQGRLRYLSHLELLRALERMIRRAGLPYAVTKGFSPHMKAAYGPALPVGVASCDEWFDIFLTALAPASEYLARLQNAAPADLRPQQAAYVDLRAESLSSALTLASYEAYVFPVDAADRPCELTDGGKTLLGGLVAAFEGVASEGSITYERNGKPKTVALEGKLARKPEFALAGELPGELCGAHAQARPCVRVSFTTRSSNEGALRPDVLMGAATARLDAAATVGREAEGTSSVGAVLSQGERVRVLILRIAQHLESEDGTWVRPI